MQPSNAQNFSTLEFLKNGTPLSGDLAVLSQSTDPSNGFNGGIFINSAGQIIIAVLGPSSPISVATPLLSVGAGYTDAQLVSGVLNPTFTNDLVGLQAQATMLAQLHGASAEPDNIFVTGNSLGGAGAEYLAQRYAYGGAAYGAPGLPSNASNPQPSNFSIYVRVHLESAVQRASRRSRTTADAA